ncbi:hypothetical protein Fmac_000372 [Flemingia macrophylla]|uniref:Peptidase S26 domain-containing protein n=1 Tax=Flemingia macrophylla TaxID=520843 RepID=A0ABD1NE28_9FABA
MAIRVTFSFSGYVAQNLASSAGVRVANSRCAQECWIRTRLFGAAQKSDLDSSAGGARSLGSGCWARSTYSSLALGDGCKSPIVLGLISLVKSTAGVSGSSAGAMGVLGISPFKTTSIIPFLPGSKRLPCNESVPDPITWEVDKGGTPHVAESNFGKTSWLSRLLNVSSEDAKAAFTAVTVSLLYKSSLAEPRSIPSSSMYPTLQVGDRVLTEKEFGFSSSDVFIKRIVAKAGDTVEVRDGELLVNGVAEKEEFLLEPLAYEMDPMVMFAI